METQKGDVWVRGKLLLIAIFIGMCTSISVSFALASLAQAEEADSSEAVQPANQGFTRPAVYRVHAQSDVVYKTDTTVDALQFAVRGSEGEELTPIAATSSAQGEVLEWRPSTTPEVGSLLVAQVPNGDSGEWRDLGGSVILRDLPTIQLNPFDSPKGGPSLAVNGSVQGMPSDIPTRIFMRLVRSSDGGEIKTYRDVTPQDGATISAIFSLDNVPTGSYRVEVIALEGEARELTKSVQLVEINRTVPSVATLSTTPQLIYAFDAFTIYGQISSPGAVSASLRYGDQFAEGLSVANDGTFSYTLPGGLGAGRYEFFVVVRDVYGNTNEGTPDAQGRFVVNILPAPSTRPVASQPLLLEPLEKDVTRRLSTNFSTPIATNRSVSSTPIVRTAARDDDMSAVLGSETEALKGVLDLDSEDDTATLPVEATPGGWMIFGTPWYWWLTGGLAATGAGVYTFRWMVRRT